jgi:hypothetical protein
MVTGASERRLRIPVRWVDGEWECDFGGRVPVRDRAEAEILVARASLADKTFLKIIERRAIHKVLEEGARLLVGLTVKPETPPRENLKRHLQRNEDLWREFGFLDSSYRYDPYFVEVQLAGPSDRQTRLFNSTRGGLWLMTHGVQAIGLASTTVKVPEEVALEPVASLNHAYTKLSEAFETWRISHTGNIYRRVLYQERNGKWCPLEVLRNRALQKAEHETAQSLCNAFMAEMTGKDQS